MMIYGNLYDADVSNEFSGGIDYFQTLRSEIARNDTNDVLKGVWSPSIYSLKMVSASAFSCTFLLGSDPVEAVSMEDGTYQISYVGGIELIQFTTSTTLTQLQIDWYADAENAKIVTFEIPDDCTVTVTTMSKRGYYTPDVYGKYHLPQGIYLISVTNPDNLVSTEKILVFRNGKIKTHTSFESNVIDTGMADYMQLSN